VSIAERVVDHETANRDALVGELGVLRALVRGEDAADARERARAAAGALGVPSTLDLVAAEFVLTGFERAVLLLAAGPELVSAVGAELEARTGSPVLTFGAALSILPDAHWSALTPTSPLRHWDLVSIEDPRTPTRGPLLVDERILHHLVGAGSLDPRLEPLVRRASAPADLPAALREAARELALQWSSGPTGGVVLQGEQPDNCRAVAVAAAEQSGSVLRELSGADLPADPVELARLVRLLGRESKLGTCAWLVTLDGVTPDVASRVARACAHDLEAGSRLTLLVRERTDLLGSRELGYAVVPVPRLDLSGRAELLTQALQAVGAASADVPAVAGVFDLTVAQAAEVARDVARGRGLWTASRHRSQVDPGGVARRIVPKASWPDLVLPPTQTAQLKALVSAVRHRSVVLEDWGFARRSSRGLGTTSLFAGASGTGKTFAAEVVAHDLDLDLLHVDLSQVVSKYIGETEKNLAAVFDAAERGSAVLLFDEADTLFGKRSEVKDSHDRYANLEVGYLLQRMEQFRGLAILTTNARGALDQAFLRRLHAVVAFPYPDVEARARLWRSAFPADTPTSDVDPDALALVDVPGGTIAAAALTAAYLAAGQGSPVTTAHVREALGWELAKSGRTVAGR
jgi:hypothetical protein